MIMIEWWSAAFAWLKLRAPLIATLVIIVNLTVNYLYFLFTFNHHALSIVMGFVVIAVTWMIIIDFYGRSCTWMYLKNYKAKRFAQRQLVDEKVKVYDNQEPMRLSDVEWCRHCRKMVANLDHHCFMLGTCVGRHNHFSFILLLLSFLVATLVFTLHTIIFYTRYLMPSIPWHLGSDAVAIHIVAFVIFHKTMVFSWLCCLLTIIITSLLLEDQHRLISMGLTVRLEYRLLVGELEHGDDQDTLLDYIFDHGRINMYSWMNRWVNLWKRQYAEPDKEQWDSSNVTHNLAMIVFDESEPDVEEMMQKFNACNQYKSFRAR